MTRDQRIGALLETVLKYAQLDFSVRAAIGDEGDEIDAIATALNVLAEELQAALASEKKILKESERLRDSEARNMELNQLNLALERKVAQLIAELVSAKPASQV